MWKAMVVAMGLLVWCVHPVSAAEAGLADVTAPEDASYTVTGGFIGYSAENQEVTVQDDNGDEMVLFVAQHVAPTINGQPSALDALRAGDRLTLTVVEDEAGDESVTALAATRDAVAAATP